MIKMIACDMDGTLLNSENQLSEANRMAVLAAQRSGIRFVVATGRGRQNVIDLLQKKDIQCGSILLNGAVYMDEQQQQLFSLPLSKPAANKAYQVFHKYELFSRIFCEDGFYSEAKKVRLMHDMLARLGLDHEFSEEELYTMAEEDDFIGITKPLIAWEETLNQQHIYKLEAFRYGSPNLEKIGFSQLPSDRLNQLSVTRPCALRCQHSPPLLNWKNFETSINHSLNRRSPSLHCASSHSGRQPFPASALSEPEYWLLQYYSQTKKLPQYRRSAPAPCIPSLNSDCRSGMLPVCRYAAG